MTWRLQEQKPNSNSCLMFTVNVNVLQLKEGLLMHASNTGDGIAGKLCKARVLCAPNSYVGNTKGQALFLPGLYLVICCVDLFFALIVQGVCLGQCSLKIFYAGFSAGMG